MNRLTAFSKGHNPDDPDIGEHAGVVKAFELNNVFFNVSCDPQLTLNWPPFLLHTTNTTQKVVGKNGSMGQIV